MNITYIIIHFQIMIVNRHTDTQWHKMFKKQYIYKQHHHSLPFESVAIGWINHKCHWMEKIQPTTLSTQRGKPPSFTRAENTDS